MPIIAQRRAEAGSPSTPALEHEAISVYERELRVTQESFPDDDAPTGARPQLHPGSVGGAKSPPPPGTALQRLKSLLALRLHGLDKDVLDVVVGTILASSLQGDPVWLFLIGPPGDGKSEILRSFSGHELIYALSSLSPNALISGYEGDTGEDPSLLPRLNEKVLVIKDFTTILDLPNDARTQILGALRDAYDGEAAKAFGSVGTRRYGSRFGLIAGVTPAIDDFWSISAQLGERFLKLRLKGGDRMDKVRRAMENVDTEDPIREEIRKASHAVLDQSTPKPSVDEIASSRIAALAEFVALARSPVNRDGSGVVKGMPVPEIGTRVAKALKKLAMGIGMAHGAERVGENEMRIITRVGVDSVPLLRVNLLRTLWAMGNNPLSGTAIASALSLPTGTATRHLEDLHILEVVDRSGNPNSGYRWRLADGFRQIIEQAGVFLDDEEENREGGDSAPLTSPESKQLVACV